MGIWLGIDVYPLVFLLIPVLVLFFFVDAKWKVQTYLALIISFGIGIGLSKTLLRNQKEDLRAIYGKDVSFKAEVIETKSWGEQTRVLTQVYSSDCKVIVAKKVYLTVSSQMEYPIGTKVFIHAKLSPFRKPSIPEQFDFEEYYRNRGVVAQVFTSKVLILGHTRSFEYWVECFRKDLAKNIDDLIKSNNEKVIIKALVVGDRAGLDPEIKQKYISAGIFHVLAVSGLHVGVIYMVLMFFVKRLRLVYVQVLVLVLGLVFYACLTGLSQSVIRATVMFMVFGFAQLIQRRTNSVNTLFASCFLILLVKPEYLFESGFQLSVSAVLGILMFFTSPLQIANERANWRFGVFRST